MRSNVYDPDRLKLSVMGMEQDFILTLYGQE